MEDTNTCNASEATAPLPKESAQDFKSLGLSPDLLECVARNNFKVPTPVQVAALPLALAGKDLLIQAQTGSGKTLAYLLPLFDLLRRNSTPCPVGRPLALVVTPTRELATQVSYVIKTLSPEIGAVEIIGGVAIRQQEKSLEKDSRVVIGTPGRILDCLRQRVLSFSDCRFCVLDEVDEMFSMGFIQDVRAILARLPRSWQGLFCSATISPQVAMLGQSFLDKPESVVVDEAGKDLPPIQHYVCQVGGGVLDKPEALCDIIETHRPRSAIVFCNTKSDTELVEAFLRRRGFDARRLNSDLPQKQRSQIMERIRKQELQLLVATDLASRGLDIEQIELVVNYSIHKEPDQYLHRTGRTGRAGRSGKAVNLVGPQDFVAFHRVGKTVEADFQELPVPTDEEVADARLSHLYELLRQQEYKDSIRDRLVAKKFLKDAFGQDQFDDASLEIIARLQQAFLSKLYVSTTRSLDEELGAAGPTEDSEPHNRPPRGDRGRGRGGGRSNDRRRR